MAETTEELLKTLNTTERVKGTEAFIFHGMVNIPHSYAAGKIGSQFLIALRDQKKITGTKCPKCKKVYVPAVSVCKDCFGTLDEMVEVSDKGTLLTYTVCHQENRIQPVKAPIIYGIIQLDGSDTGFVHMLGEVNPENIKIGMKVQAVFKEDRVASILDIKYFKPLS